MSVADMTVRAVVDFGCVVCVCETMHMQHQRVSESLLLLSFLPVPADARHAPPPLESKLIRGHERGGLSASRPVRAWEGKGSHEYLSIFVATNIIRPYSCVAGKYARILFVVRAGSTDRARMTNHYSSSSSNHGRMTNNNK